MADTESTGDVMSGSLQAKGTVSDAKSLPQRPRGDERFHQLLKKIGDLHDLKQVDYGQEGDPFSNVRASEEFGIPGWIGCMVRANDKMRRIQKFAKSRELVNESVTDSLLDLAVYSLIALILFEETLSEPLAYASDETMAKCRPWTDEEVAKIEKFFA